MLTDAQLQNISACIDFTRRNAPLSGEQFALVGEAMTAVEAELQARKKTIPNPAEPAPKAKKRK